MPYSGNSSGIYHLSSSDRTVYGRMYCQLGQDIHQLRRRNRDLLHELESNSVLLENRLKKLRHTARTPKHSDKSWRDLPPSPLKRKYDSWRARNSSGHVAAALNRNLQEPASDDSSNNDPDTVKQFPKSPAKRWKKNVRIVPGAKKKHNHHRSSKTSPQKEVIKHRMIQKLKKPCPECYCPDIYIEVNSCDENDDDKSRERRYLNSRGQELRNCTGCRRDHSELDRQCSQGTIANIHPDDPSVKNVLSGQLSRPLAKTCDTEPTEISSYPIWSLTPPKETVHTTTPRSSAHLLRTLDEARPVLNYSPESVFLRRMKKRAQVLEGNCTDHIIKDDKSKVSRTTQTCRCNESESSPEEVNENRPYNTRRRQECCCRSSRAEAAQTTPTKEALSHSCATQTSRDLGDECRSRRKERSSCCCRRVGSPRSSRPAANTTHVCKCKEPQQQQIHLGNYNIMTELVENKMDLRHVNDPCQSAWFEEMNKFRNKHWFDCHAHDQGSSTKLDRDLRSNLTENNLYQHQHKCAHQFALNERMFPEPGYSDHRSLSRCQNCHLPLGTARAPRLPHEVTLPSRRQPSNVQVTVPNPIKIPPPISVPLLNVPSSKKLPSTITSGSSILSKLKPPVPTNSLALRYQRGVV